MTGAGIPSPASATPATPPIPRARRLAPLAGAIALTLTAITTAQAQSGNDRETQREVTVGLGWLDEGAFRYGRYTGLVSAGLQPRLEFRMRSMPTWDGDDTFYWSAQGTRLGQDSRRLNLEVGDVGRQRLTLELRQIPRYTSDSSRTPFQDVNSAFLSLPADWETTGNTTANLPSLGTALDDVNLRERRTRFTLGYQRELDARWHFNVNYRHEQKDGRRLLGGTTGSTGGNARAAQLPVPIDFTTEVLDLGITRTTDRSSAGFSYTGSFFRNAHSSVSWQVPFGPHPQWADGVGYPNGIGRLSLEPDNSFHQLGFAAGHAFSSTLRMNLGLSYGRMIQDQALLPYTVNPALDVSTALPRSSLDGRVDLTRFNVGISARPSPRLQVNATYRFDDRNDQTPREAWQLIRSDSEDQRVVELARLNRPYSLREHSLRADVGYRVSRGIRLQGGYRYTDQSRDYSEVDSVEEHRYSMGVRFSTLDILALSLDLLHARRSIGDYVGNRPLIETRVPGTVGEDDFENHPLLRKYYLADRDRDGARVRADIPLGSGASIGMSAAYHRDDYRNSVFGLTRASMRTATLDGSVYPAADLRLTAFVTLDRYTNEQAGRSFNATPAQQQDPERDWWVSGRDRFTTTGLSVGMDSLEQRWAWLGERAEGRSVAAGLDVVHADSRGALKVRSGPALTTSDLPPLRTRLNFYRLHASYPLRNDAQLRFALEHERYRSRDFGYDSVAPDTIPNVLSSGHESPRYRVNWVVVSYAARF